MKTANASASFALLKSLFVAAAFAVAVIVPAYFSLTATAQESSSGEMYFGARLTGPQLGSLTPRGVAAYASEGTTKRVLHLEIAYVDLPAGTTLSVEVDGSAIATVRVSAYKTAGFELKTEAGQNVPVIGAGSTISVKGASGTAILTGTFNPPPSPSPMPTGSPIPTPSPFPTPSAAFYAPLSGATIDGVLPKGVSSYFEFGSGSKDFSLFVEHVKLSNGTQLSVEVNGVFVGSFTLNDEGEGRIRVSNLGGVSVPLPTIVSGDTVSVKNGSSVVLTGTYKSPNQAPPPQPRPNRYFWGKLNGASVVPPVSGNGRGRIEVKLNDTETSIRVELGFIDLSSNQTSATINGPAIAGENGSVVFDLGAVGGTVGRIENKTFAVTPEQVAQLRAGSLYVQIGSANNPNGEIRAQIKGRTRVTAFTGATTDDVAVYRPSTGTWFVSDGGSGLTAKSLGSSTDTPVSADYDGDGKTDYAVFRNGAWTISRSSDGGTTLRNFGTAGDIPVRGDYDGDGITDITVYRPSSGMWYFQSKNGSGFTGMHFGIGEDKPVAADLDGDGRTDITVFRPSTGIWYSMLSSTGRFYAVHFGMQGDMPIAGDFDGDGADDITVYRPSNGVWYTWKATTWTFDARQFGAPTDVPVAGNFDGDGVTDIAVFRPSNGIWYIWRSSDNAFDYRYFGMSGDVPTGKN